MDNESNEDVKLTLKEAIKRGVRPAIIIIPVTVFVIIVILGITIPNAFLAGINTAFSVLMVNGGWLMSLGTLFFVIFMIVILIHPFGKVRLGGKDAKPEYSRWNWFCISLCAGIGTGIVFWGAVEPVLFTVQPQLSAGIEGGTRQAAIWALSKSFMHWSFAPYACYGIFGICIAFGYYNLKKSFAVSSAFAPMLGNTTEKSWFRGIIDTITVLAITGAVAGSLGYGLLQIGSGLNTVFGIPLTTMLYVTICVIIVASYLTSSVTGMKNGIRWLSDKNAWLFLILMVLVFICGPTSWICNLFTESVGSFFSTFLQSITSTAAFSDVGTVVGSVWSKGSEMWSQWWDQYTFMDFLAFAPIIGLFTVKVAKGRTLREFVIFNWIIPAAFGMIWFAIFGGLSLDIQYNYPAYANRVNLEGCASLFDYMQTYGNEAMMLKVIEAIPFSVILKPIFLIVITISFITMADSMTSTVSLMTIKRNKGVSEAPTTFKLGWGVIMGAVALILTITGGIECMKMMKSLAGFPILIIGLIMVTLFLVYIVKHGKDKEIQDMM